MAADILKTLKDEHDQLRELFKEMEGTTERAEKGRMDLLEKIKQGLIPHAVWEEEVFYPEFKKRADRDGRKTHAEAVAEHRAVELRVLPDLEAASPTTTEFAGRAKVLGEFVKHHATEEEDTMFKMARSMFSAEERAQLDEQYKNWKGTPAAAQAIEKALLKGAEANKANPPPAA
ncbi:hemerythrin domain-containing protein [Lysobacter ciconiae]|uniref:Hemerythrin domain-containing protein n=1 Tax=Novilysobacter ciconiae TaxID=2781022 RepID=A0A7S6UFC1_9GAMM|nr:MULTISPECIES: hemerythrin domain-containing protein [Lysobacter]QOW19251.1 hemerythrin domain-containing protein [Lysobacter ciconiae]QOY62465.1 hemerythrin domain-containing protein [Lysobacter sp. H21R4]